MAPRKRISRISPNPIPHQCLFCSNVYQGYKALEVHMNLHTGEHPYECTECPATFPDHRYLSTHLDLVHRNKRYPCDLCSDVFKESVYLRRHKDIVHYGKKYICGGCHQEYYSQGTLNRHRDRGSCSGVVTKISCPKKGRRVSVVQAGIIKGVAKKSVKVIRKAGKNQGDRHVNATGGTKRISSKSNLLASKTVKMDKAEKSIDKSSGHSKIKTERKFGIEKEVIRKAGKNHGDHFGKLPGATKKTSSKTNLESLKSIKIDKAKKSEVGKIQKEMSGVEKVVMGNPIWTELPPGTSSNWLPHRCLFCSNVYQGYKALEVHMNQHTEEHPYECDECPTTFTDHRYLRRHRDLVHRNKSYACNLCSSIFKDNRGLRKHQERTHCPGNKFSCDTDTKMMSPKTGNFDKEEKSIERSSAGNTAVNMGKISEIRKEVTGNPPAERPSLIKTEEIIDQKPVFTKSAVYKCSQCPTTHLDRNLLLKHAAERHELKTFECPICKNLYTQYQNMTRHLKAAHGDEDDSPELIKWRERRTKCSLCSMTFESFPLILEHKKMKHDLKLFKCTHCPNEYTQYSNMVRHRKSHGDNPVIQQISQVPRVRAYTTTMTNTTTNETTAKKEQNECTRISNKALEQRDTQLDQFPVFVNGEEMGLSKDPLQDQAHQQLLQMVAQLRIQKEQNDKDVSFFLHLNRYDPSSV